MKKRSIKNSFFDHAASLTDPNVRGWQPFTFESDTDLASPVLGDRCWDLYISSPLCTAIVETLVTNVVGTGLWLAAGDGALRDAWDDVTASCGLDGEPLREILELAFRTAILRGDAFLEVSFAPLTVSVIDPRSTVSVGAEAPFGIKRDSRGRATQYLFKAQDDLEIVERPAFTREHGGIIHFHMPFIDARQERGCPLLAPGLIHLHALSKFTLSEINSAVLTSRVAMAWTRNANLRAGLEEDGEGREEVHIPDSSVVELLDGEELQLLQPNRPNPNMDAFIVTVAQKSAAAARLPLSAVLLVYGSSYTAPRIEILEAQRTYELWRLRIAETILRPIARALGFPAGVGWTGRPAIVVDPLREVQAAKLRIDESLSTREAEAWDATGMELDEILDQRAAEERQILETIPRPLEEMQ